MTDESTNLGEPEDATNAASLPAAVDRATFQAELDRLRVREKAHTREGDAIAAARRRLPMVEVDGATPLIGLDGPTTLLEAFEGRRQLIAYPVRSVPDGEMRSGVSAPPAFRRPAERRTAPQLHAVSFNSAVVGRTSDLARTHRSPIVPWRWPAVSIQFPKPGSWSAMTMRTDPSGS